MSPLSDRPLRAAALVLAGALPAACAAPAPADGGPQPRGSVHLVIDNDSYNFDDGNYTNGFSAGWVSPELGHYPEGHWLRGTNALFGPLMPGEEDAERHVGLAAGQLIFTPEFLSNANPAEDERPYAGVLFVDLVAMEKGEETLATTTLRVGLVGDASLAEEFQKELHEWFGADRPKGWEHQLNDEPILNLGFERQRRFSSGRVAGLGYDLARDVGGALGTYFTGLNAGLELRLGPRLPADMGSRTMRTGFETLPLLTPPEDARATTYGFLRAEGYAVARYLPVDGTVFRDEDRSVEHEDFVGSLALGLTFAQGPISMSFSYRVVSDTYETQTKTGQYGTVSLTWFPGAR